MRYLLLIVMICGVGWGQCGKLVVNPTTGRLDCIGSTTSVTPGGSSGSIQYNNSGSFGGANITQAPDGSDNASMGLTWAAPYTPTYNNSGTTTCDLSKSNFCQITFTSSGGSTT